MMLTLNRFSRQIRTFHLSTPRYEGFENTGFLWRLNLLQTEKKERWTMIRDAGRVRDECYRRAALRYAWGEIPNNNSCCLDKEKDSCCLEKENFEKYTEPLPPIGAPRAEHVKLSFKTGKELVHSRKLNILQSEEEKDFWKKSGVEDTENGKETSKRLLYIEYIMFKMRQRRLRVWHGDTLGASQKSLEDEKFPM